MKTLLTTFATFTLTFGLFAVDFKISTPKLIEKGKTIYKAKCASCHGVKGDSDSPMGKSLKVRNLVSDKFKNGNTTEGVFKSITEGIKGTTMTSYKKLSEEERWALSHYVMTLHKK